MSDINFMRACEVRWVLSTWPRGGAEYEDWMRLVAKHRGQTEADSLRQRVRMAFLDARS